MWTTTKQISNSTEFDSNSTTKFIYIIFNIFNRELSNLFLGKKTIYIITLQINYGLNRFLFLIWELCTVFLMLKPLNFINFLLPYLPEFVSGIAKKIAYAWTELLMIQVINWTLKSTEKNGWFRDRGHFMVYSCQNKCIENRMHWIITTSRKMLKILS